MGRDYAGVLGPVAFATVVGRGVLAGGSVDTTIKTAGLCLFAFAALGWVLGTLADRVLLQAIEVRFNAELKKHAEAKARLAERSS